MSSSVSIGVLADYVTQRIDSERAAPRRIGVDKRFELALSERKSLENSICVDIGPDDRAGRVDVPSVCLHWATEGIIYRRELAMAQQKTVEPAMAIGI
jgi:hypothetical protein